MEEQENHVRVYTFAFGNLWLHICQFEALLHIFDIIFPTTLLEFTEAEFIEGSTQKPGLYFFPL